MARLFSFQQVGLKFEMFVQDSHFDLRTLLIISFLSKYEKFIA